MNPYLHYGPPVGHVFVWVGEDWYFLPEGTFTVPIHNGATLHICSQAHRDELKRCLEPRWPEPQSLAA